MIKIKKLLLGSLLLTFCTTPIVAYADTPTNTETIKETNTVGWYKYQNKWKYRNEKGVDKTNTWLFDNNKWYYFDKNGFMVTGWQSIKDKWYYFSQNGFMKTGWVKYNNNWYFMNSKTGQMTVGWLYSKGTYYYFKSDGKMAKGWVSWQGHWYYMGLINGDMKTDTKLFLNDGTYFVKKNGQMATNEVCQIGSGYSYFQKNGLILKEVKFIKWNNNTYLANGTGSLYQNKLLHYKDTYYYAMNNATIRNLPNQKAAELAWSYNCDLRSGWEYAVKQSGDSKTKATLFRDLAYAMGYEVYLIEGEITVSNKTSKHYWVELKWDDGNWYECDPYYASKKGIDLYYLFNYGKYGTYTYKNYKRIN